MVQGNDILNYQGNVGLGLNSEGLSSYGDTDTSALNTAVFNLAYLNHQKNKDIYDQKIKDRDASANAIAAGQMEINQVLPEHRAELEKMIDETKKVFYDNGGDIKSNNKVWADFNDKLAKFKSADAQAKANLIMYDKGMQEAAVETNPVKKERMLSHWEAEKTGKKPTEIFTPYQQTLDFDVKKTLPGAVTSVVKSRNGQDDVEDVTTDIPGTFDKYLMDYMQNDKGETKPNVDAHYKDMYTTETGMPEDAIVNHTQITNDLLKKIAMKNGYDITGSTAPLPKGVKPLPAALQPIQLVQDPATGKWRTVDRPDVAMAKTNLALNYKSGRTVTPNPKYAAMDKTNADIKNNAAKTAAYVATQKTIQEKNRMAAKLSRLKSKPLEEAQKDMENIFDDMIANKKQNPAFGDVIYAGDIPDSYKNIASGVGADGKPMAIRPFKFYFDGKNNEIKDIAGVKSGKIKPARTIELFKVQKTPYYTTPDGQRISESKIKEGYASLSADQKKSFPTLEDYVQKNIVDRFGAKQEQSIYGQNGAVTPKTTLQAQRNLQNKSITQKFDDGLYGSDESTEPPVNDE